MQARRAVRLLALAAVLVAQSALSQEVAFRAQDVLDGVKADQETCTGEARVWVEAEGTGECLRLYAHIPPGADAARPLLVYLGGDSVVGGNRFDGNAQVSPGYDDITPAQLQRQAEQVGRALQRAYVILARPGVFGSSGDHLQRRRPREVALVDRALNQIRVRLGQSTIDLVGFSGGGHLVAALIARRSDIGCAVIASGNVAVLLRAKERGRDIDFTGYADSVDPIALVADVARRPPRRIIVLTDPEDRVVSGSSQAAYVEALRAAGVAVEHRLVPATDTRRHDLRRAGLLAAAGCGAG